MTSPQPGWRWCSVCQGLFFAGHGTGACPAGGTGHDESGSGDYALDQAPDSPGQHGWRWCNVCQGLFFAGNGAGVCPAGGGHDESGSGDYALDLAPDSPGQHGWRWCNICQGLFFGGSAGVCPAGGGHDESGSGDYSLNFAGQTTESDFIQLDPDEFPAVLRALHFAGDVDGYLQNLGIDPTGLGNDLPGDFS